MSSGAQANWVALEGIDNLRDLGGIAVEGGSIRKGRLFRSSTVQGASDSDWDVLVRALGVGRMIDLRTPAEAAREGIGVFETDEIEYVNIPFAGRAHDVNHLVPIDDDAPSIVSFYGDLLEQGGAAVVAAARVLIQSPTSPTVVFCAAGKDRTGVLVATVLDALGASQESIARDYALTDDRMPQVRERLANLASYPHIGTIRPAWLAASDKTMIAFLSGLHQDHGGGSAWLKSRGFGERELATLRSVLVDDDFDIGSRRRR